MLMPLPLSNLTAVAELPYSDGVPTALAEERRTDSIYHGSCSLSPITPVDSSILLSLVSAPIIWATACIHNSSLRCYRV